MQAEPEIGAADHTRIVLRFEPPGPQVHTPRGQTGEPPLELGPPRAVAGHQDDELGKSHPRIRRLPASNPILEAHHSIDDDVEVFVFRPARRADDETHDADVNTQAGEQRLTVMLALDTLHRDKD